MTAPPKARALLLEQLATAYRELTPHGQLREAAAFHDLDEAGRTEAFELALRARVIEAAIDPLGRSSTVHAVLARLRR
jgi:hypothetical protein